MASIRERSKSSVMGLRWSGIEMFTLRPPCRSCFIKKDWKGSGWPRILWKYATPDKIGWIEVGRE